MISREDAIQLLEQNLKDPRKKKHSYYIAEIMKALSQRLSLNEGECELVGLLHDLDYDLIGKETYKHGLVAAEILSSKLPEDGIHAIKAHDYRTGIKPTSNLDKALIACDCVWTLIIRVAYTTGHGSLSKIKLYSLRNGYRSKSFPPFLKSGIAMCKDFGLSVEEFLEIALRALPKDLKVTQEDI